MVINIGPGDYLRSSGQQLESWRVTPAETRLRHCRSQAVSQIQTVQESTLQHGLFLSLSPSPSPSTYSGSDQLDIARYGRDGSD